MDLADDDRRPVGRRRKRPRGEPGPEPYTDAHPGEPDPRCADEQLPGEEHGHAGRDVVPRDDGAIHVRGVVADEHRHGIGLGKHAGPRPGAPDTAAADDQERADESANIAALVAARRPARVRAGEPSGRDTYRRERPPPKARGGRSRHVPLRWRGSGRPVLGRKAEQRQRKMEGVSLTPPLCPRQILIALRVATERGHH